MLAILDICYTLTLIPHMIDTEYCIYRKYAVAFYYAYFGQPLIYYFRHISIYVLVNLSLDRFLAIWCNQIFQKITCYTTTRFIIIWLWITISMIPHILLGDISHQGSDQWVAIRGSRNIKNPGLQKVYKLYMIIAFGVLPSILLISLTIGMIIGILKKTLMSNRLSGNISKKRQCFSIKNLLANKSLTLTFAVLVFNTFYVGSIIPFILYWNRVEERGCHFKATEEMTKSTFFCILMSWVVLNLWVFFIITTDYRKQLRVVLCRCKDATSPEIF